MAGLLLSLSIRILKSLVYFTFPEAPQIIPAIGLIGMSLCGPFLRLFTDAMKGRAFNARRDLYHFGFPLAIALTLLVNSAIVFRIGYHLTVLQLFVYLIWSLQNLRGTSLKKVPADFLKRLIIGIGAIWSTFLLQLVIPDILTYAIVTGTASLVLFVITLQVFGHFGSVFGQAKAFDRQDPAIEKIRDQLRVLLEEEKVYKSADLNARLLAERLQTKPHLLSGIINQFYEKSIPELINAYRVEHAKVMLLSNPDNLKIEAIAYEAGFNSPSAFYREFKKHTATSPRHFLQRKTNA